jgi:type II secretory pathway predicted ATPase ExeA
MIRSFFGLDQNPFIGETPALLPQQREVFETLRVHCQQGGLCLVVGEPGTGKSVIKQALCRHDSKRMLTPVINRTLHTYHSTLRILCEAFQIDTEGLNFKCERRLIEEGQRLNHAGKTLVPVIDDAHLMSVDSLRRLRLLFEDFPKNHNLILFAQPGLLGRLALAVNDDIKSRVTYSVLLPRLGPEDIKTFIRAELDRVALALALALALATFSDDALALIIRSSEGILRRVRNLCIGCLLDCVRDRSKHVELKHVNRVLLQPHWRREFDLGDVPIT